MGQSADGRMLDDIIAELNREARKAKEKRDDFNAKAGILADRRDRLQAKAGRLCREADAVRGGSGYSDPGRGRTFDSRQLVNEKVKQLRDEAAALRADAQVSHEQFVELKKAADAQHQKYVLALQRIRELKDQLADRPDAADGGPRTAHVLYISRPLASISTVEDMCLFSR